MRTYTEQWNYTLSPTSTPYSYNNGSPYFSGGRAYFPQNSFINKDTFGTYQFGSNNYVGSYALRLQVDLSAAAKLVEQAKAEEREACANVCASHGGIWQKEMLADTALRLAAAIRARGHK